MVKRILLFLVQLLAFGTLLIVGGYWDIIHLLIQIKMPSLNFIPLIKFHVTADHDLVANGIIFAGALLVLIVLFEALRKALKPWASISILAYAVAVAISLFAKLGLPPSHS